MIQLVDAIHHIRQNALDGPKAHLAARARLRDLEHRALGVVDDFARLAPFGLERAADDAVARR